jgi:hypothetical protein
VPTGVRALVKQLARENPRWGTGASRVSCSAWGTGWGKDDPPDPSRCRVGTSAAAGVADLAAVPDIQAPGILACDFLHVDTVLLR